MCSAGSLVASEPLAGTASVAQSWVVIEQPGPWCRQALTDSHPDRLLGESLLAASAASGTTILLARHPDRLERDDPSRHDSGTRNVWVAHTAPGHTRMRHGMTADLSEIASVNLRFSWNYRPGSDVFLVYNETWNAPSLGDLTRKDRQVMLKATYLFQK